MKGCMRRRIPRNGYKLLVLADLGRGAAEAFVFTSYPRCPKLHHFLKSAPNPRSVPASGQAQPALLIRLSNISHRLLDQLSQCRNVDILQLVDVEAHLARLMLTKV